VSITHANFTIERTYPVAPERVYSAFADPAKKAKWFGGPPEWTSEQSMDFREGGRETSVGGPVGGPVHSFEATYVDIVPNERIVYTYELNLDDARLSVSLTTIEIATDGAGTRLTLTELGAFFDDLEDPAEREHGTGLLLDGLGAYLAGRPTR
jgi:uncharacterized protein YndB with AHSA1/START domain